MSAPWQSERELTTDLAAQLIESQFSRFAPLQIEYLGAGWDNNAFLVNQEFVFRFPRREFAVPFLETERRILPAIAGRLPVPIPHPMWFGEPSEPFPWPFLGYRLVPGQTACRANLTDQQRTELAGPLANFLRELHAISVQELMPLGLQGDSLGRLNLTKRIAQTEERLALAKSNHWLAEFDQLETILHEAAQLEGVTEKRTLVHGDLYARHLLVDQKCRLSAVIDWGDVHLNNPAADLMIVHRFLPPDSHSVFHEVYGPIDDVDWSWARFRALNHSLLVLPYAHSTNDFDLLRDTETSLRYLAAA